ncbi:MAG: deoxyribodipyrimidine photo-lyase [Pseudomonadota bacterium]
MTSDPTTIVWLRRDLRLRDNLALDAALGGPVIPVFILDDVIDAQLGAAARLRLKLSLEALSKDFAAKGIKLVLRRGDALEILRALASETGARRVTWTRLTDGPSIERDKKIKASLKDDGLEVESFGGFTLLDPWRVRTGQDTQFKVFTPFSKALMQHDIPEPAQRPSHLAAYDGDVASDDLNDWRLEAAMGPAADALAKQIAAGEDAARDRLDAWLDERGARYDDDRNRLDKPEAGTRLSEYLALGEISPRSVWAAMDRADGDAGVEAARRQLIWRDFAHMLLFHDPDMETENWRREWSAFPWREDNEDAERWRRGETGVEVVDAAMREMYVTGRMHNRARMLTASYLTKHLMTHWRVGEAWFRETLIDWDPANNAMGWQWVAGCGPDAAPFFRIFNPETQGEKFDPFGAYRKNWIRGEGAETFAAMRPKSHQRNASARPRPLVELSEGRKRALEAWKEMREKGEAV